MSDKEALAIYWTGKALKNASSIKVYLKENFSEREIDSFYSLLSAFEESVKVFPELYPQTNNETKIRRAVLSKVLSVFYRILNDKIEVLAVLDNRSDVSEWLQTVAVGSYGFMIFD